jgi:uncharacterized protein
LIAAAAAVFAGAFIQSVAGFGFALMAAPLLFVALGAEEAVWSLNALALVVNGSALALEGRRPEPLGRLAVTVLAWGVPGMVAGALILRSVDDRILQVALTVIVLLTLVARRADSTRATLGAPATGAVTGVLTTSLSTAGPPLVLLLLGRGYPPVRVRDTLATVFIAQSVLGLAALAATSGGDIPVDGDLALLAVAALLGQLAGRPLFARLAHRDYERVLTAVLILSVSVGLVAALV